MKEYPILFSAPMVRAILDGHKTQTRRIIKPQLPDKPTAESGKKWGIVDDNFYYCGVRCPYGKPGDRLWVRENHYITDDGDYEQVVYAADLDASEKHREMIIGLLATHRFSAEWSAPHLRQRPSIHMPRWACRILLEIVSVRVERLQDISRGDAMGEGSPFQNLNGQAVGNTDPVGWFVNLWRYINGAESWCANPWVWVIDFKRVDA